MLLCSSAYFGHHLLQLFFSSIPWMKGGKVGDGSSSFLLDNIFSAVAIDGNLWVQKSPTWTTLNISSPTFASRFPFNNRFASNNSSALSCWMSSKFTIISFHWWKKNLIKKIFREVGTRLSKYSEVLLVLFRFPAIISNKTTPKHTYNVPAMAVVMWLLLPSKDLANPKSAILALNFESWGTIRVSVFSWR